jgi:delta(3,5)-delta(2,4)-dienoyl-CoA isomerase
MAASSLTNLETLKVEVIEDHIAIVTISRPQKLNAMSCQFFQDVETMFRRIDNDPMVRVVVMHAEGRLFSAGLDLHDAAKTAGLLSP